MKNSIIGIIPDDWEVSDLNEICEFITDGSHYSPKEQTAGFFMASVKDMTPMGFDFTNCKLISEKDFNDLKRNNCSPEIGDILISKDGANCLEIIFEYDQDKSIVLLSSIAIARVKKNHSSKFYTYWLQSQVAQKIMKNWFISGSAIPRVVLKDFKKVPVPLPPNRIVEEKIANIIGLFDKKISLLRRQNEILEAMAQALFRHWFIDFEFPVSKEYAEALGQPELEGKPYRSSGGKMVYKGIDVFGIPEWWEIKSLSEIASFLNGLALQKFPPESVEDSLPVIKIREMKSGLTENADRASNKIPDKYIVKFGDILFSWSGSLELVNWIGEDGALNQHLFKITSYDYSSWFIYMWTNFHLQDFRSIAESKATTMGHIQRHHLDQALCLIPQQNDLKIMDRNLTPIYQKRLTNSKEINTLKMLREILLPKLMNGEISI